MKRLFLKLVFGIILIPLVFNSCQKDALDESMPMDDALLKNGVIVNCTDANGLYAGQHDLVGNVIVSNDDVNLYVKFITWGHFMTNTKLWVGCNPADMPLNKKGGPKLGHFPVNDDQPNITEVMYTFPLAELSCGNIAIAAHADVIMMCCDDCESETAWGWDCGETNTAFGTSWGSYFWYTVDFCLQ